MKPYKRYFTEAKPHMFFISNYDGDLEATPVTFKNGKVVWSSGDKVPTPCTILKQTSEITISDDKKSLNKAKTGIWAYFTYKGGNNFKFSDYARESELKKFEIDFDKTKFDSSF
jgi:hypothetical protein